MSKIELKKQKAARRGMFIIRSIGNPKKWDVIGWGGPCCLEMTRREAINLAFQWSKINQRVKMYGQDASGVWHRGNCEKIARNPARAKPCQCQRLIVK